MKTFDIRKNDVVQLRAELTEVETARIAKFGRIVSGQSGMETYVKDVFKNNNKKNNQRTKFTIHEIKETQKKPTEYALLITSYGILIPIQTRYLQVVVRKPKHPLTNIFQNQF